MNIRTCLLTGLLFYISIGFVHAQSDAKFGLTLGYDYPIVNQEDKLLVARQSGQDFRPISVAISFQQQRSERWLWEWTLAYRPRGEQKETVTFDGLNQEKLSVRTDFIDLQTKINWFPFSEGQVQPYFSGGVYLGYLLKSNFQYEIVRDPVLTYEHDLNSSLRKINAGIVAGLGIEADLGKLTLFTEAAFQKGLMQLSKPENSELSGFTHELYLSGGYRISTLSLALGILYDLP